MKVQVWSKFLIAVALIVLVVALALIVLVVALACCGESSVGALCIVDCRECGGDYEDDWGGG
jgi:hypothetical protein